MKAAPTRILCLALFTVLFLITPFFATADPLEHPAAGPMLVCFKSSTFQLLAGETVTDFNGGMEGMQIEITGPSGHYAIREGDNLAIPRDTWHRRLRLPLPKDNRKLMSWRGNTKVYRIRGTEPGYAVFGPTDYSGGRDTFVAWIAGEALRDADRAIAIYSRLDVRDTSEVHCLHTFTYGWEYVVPG